MLKPVLDFLFGKAPKIFNKKGAVQHELGAIKWKAWKDRFRKNPDYDYTQHRGRTEDVP